MSDIAYNFLSSRLPIGGLAAYSIHLAKAMLAMECFSKSLYPTSIEQMLCRIVQGGQALLPSGEHGAHYCWTFEGHQVYVAARPDGACLALLVENNGSAQLVRIKEALRDFLELKQI